MDAIYRFEFIGNISRKKIEDTLCVAILNAESIFGETKVRLDGSVQFNKDKRICVIDKSTEVGRHIACYFTSLLRRSLGDRAFKVERLRRRKKFMENQSTQKINKRQRRKTV